MDKKAALELWKRFCSLTGLWEGWQHADTPVALYNDHQAVLLAHPSPPTEYVQREVDGEHVYVAEPKPEYLTANTAIELGGCFVATMRYDGAQSEAALALLAHEAFHVYQAEQGFPMANIMLMGAYPIFDPLVNALGEVEAFMLSRALTKDDIVAVKAALDARAARQALLTAELRAYENNNELHEGLATYIEIRAAGLAGEVGRRNLDYLAKCNCRGWGASRMRFYYSGMAYGLLADSLAAGWQQVTDVEKTHPAELLAAALGHQANSERRQFTPLDFAEIYAQQVEGTIHRQQELERQVRAALPGQGLRVEVSLRGQVTSGGWNPFGVKVLPDQTRFHPTVLTYNYDSGAKLRVSSGALEVAICQQIVFERDDLTVIVDGLVWRGSSARGRLEVRGTDCYLLVPKAIISLAAGVLQVTEDT
ncbi:MAG: hypothetical protein GX060_08585 [Firmicutes bacterium]|nr:hypothetical protein [Bacillota bacterium]